MSLFERRLFFFVMCLGIAAAVVGTIAISYRLDQRRHQHFIRQIVKPDCLLDGGQ